MTKIDLDTPTPDKTLNAEDRSAGFAVWAFPAFILLGAIAAFFFPAPFQPISAYITPMLAIIMFCIVAAG